MSILCYVYLYCSGPIIAITYLNGTFPTAPCVRWFVWRTSWDGTYPGHTLNNKKVSRCFTLHETNSSHLKMDGWNTSFLLGWPIFRCYVSFRKGNHPPKWILNESCPSKLVKCKMGYTFLVSCQGYPGMLQACITKAPCWYESTTSAVCQVITGSG